MIVIAENQNTNNTTFSLYHPGLPNEKQIVDDILAKQQITLVRESIEYNDYTGNCFEFAKECLRHDLIVVMHGDIFRNKDFLMECRVITNKLH